MLRRLPSLRRRLPSPTFPQRCLCSSDSDNESMAYRRSMYRRPPTVKPSKIGSFNHNVSTFIGRLVCPVKPFDQDPDRVYTSMEVDRLENKKPASSVKVLGQDPDSTYTSTVVDNKKPVRIGLRMRGKIAAQAQRYLKPDDYIYVRGFLGSYELVDENGKAHVKYKVEVNILNYVQSWNQNVSPPQRASSSSESIVTEQDPESIVTKQDPAKERHERLCLWGTYFASPGEWWDNRKEKKYPNAPDFKHKDTKESLWLSPDDPPWIQKQLQKNDSRMVTGFQGKASRRCLESSWDI